MSKLTWSTATNFLRPVPKEIWRSFSSMSFSLSAIGVVLHHFLAQVLDRVGALDLGRPGVQIPGLGGVGGRHIEEGRLLDKVNGQGLLVAGGKGVAVDVVERVGRAAVEGGRRPALAPRLRP